MTPRTTATRAASASSGELDKTPTRQNVVQALEMLVRMTHRGACGCEENTGDGAGILSSIPHDFFRAVAPELNLPAPGEYGLGMFYLPKDDPDARATCVAAVEAACAELDMRVLGWRDVPTDAKRADLGDSALATEPEVAQLFVAAEALASGPDFETRLTSCAAGDPGQAGARRARADGLDDFYVLAQLAHGGVQGAAQAGPGDAVLPDLRDERFTAYLSLVHSRFSTNTFPSWDRAQPLHMMGHNGEINTLKGNANWMLAREGLVDVKKLGVSEALQAEIAPPSRAALGFGRVRRGARAPSSRAAAGRRGGDDAHDPRGVAEQPEHGPRARAFYEFHSAVMEPWDGPALGHLHRRPPGGRHLR